MPRRAFEIPARVWLRIVLYFAACWSMAAVLVNGLFPGAVSVTLALAVYTTTTLVIFLRNAGWPFYPGAVFRILVFRVFWYVQVLLFLVTITGAAAIVVGSFSHAELRGGRDAAGTIAALMVLLYLAGYVGSKGLRLRRVEVDIADLPDDLVGTTIAQISDLHVGPHVSRRFLARVAKMVRESQPDLIAITGDLVDDRHEDIQTFAERVGPLSAPLGVWVIAGNHDVYAGWTEVERDLAMSHIGRLLLNESRIIERGRARFALVGTGDPAGDMMHDGRAAPKIEQAMARVPAGIPVIALAHNPLLWRALRERGVDLTISGHTHWGQLAIPSLNWCLASMFLEHSMGMYREGKSTLYISPGTGYWGIPFRIGATSEVTVLRLRRAE